MKAHFIHEPELEFGSGRHIDIRFGLTHHGPLDSRVHGAMRECRVAVIGDGDGVDTFREWVDQCRPGVAAKETRLRNLFPPFPGFGEGGCLPDFVCNDAWSRSLSERSIAEVCGITNPVDFAEASTRLYTDEAEDLIEKGMADVVVCLMPPALVKRVDVGSVEKRGPRSRRRSDRARSDAPIWHDYFKAKCLQLQRPVQLARPGTFGGDVQRYSTDGTPSRLIQDDATRAWNFFCAQYYKAGGVPWRLVREASELLTCYVGVSFFHSVSDEEDPSVQTSIAQVFNERGEGVVVRGGPARIRKDDRSPHLSKQDAVRLLSEAIERFRKEHKTMPARLVIHKSSWFDEDERDGLRDAADQYRIELLDLLSLRRTQTRFFRKSGTYPPLRGTAVQLDDTHALLYSHGSVDFYRAYPGLYAPRPLLVTVEQAATGIRPLLKELLGLTKMNWNSTQFVNSMPITLAASRSVGDILRYAPQDAALQARYGFYM
jgi:hypothetical protein